MAKLMRRQEAKIPTGAYDRRVTIQQQLLTKTASGGSNKAWTTVVSTWAHMEPWKGNEYWNAQQVEARLFERVIIRYRPSLNITPSMQVVYGNRTLNIRTVTVLAEAQQCIEMLCEEIASKGSAP